MQQSPKYRPCWEADSPRTCAIDLESNIFRRDGSVVVGSLHLPPQRHRTSFARAWGRRSTLLAKRAIHRVICSAWDALAELEKSWIVEGDFQQMQPRWKRAVMSFTVQQVVCALIILDSGIVFGECVVDSIIDDRKDVAGTWVHGAHVFGWALEKVGAILVSIFAVELSSMIISLGVDFFKNPIYVLDLCMVSSTLLEELVRPLTGRRLEHSFALLLRVWRVVRVAHGVYMIMFLKQEAQEKEIHSLRVRVANLEHEMIALRCRRHHMD